MKASMLSSFSLFLSCVAVSPMAEKALFAVTLMEAWLKVRHGTVFPKLSDLFYVASKRLISNCTSGGIVSWSSLSWITWTLCFDFKWLIKSLVLEPSVFSLKEHKLHFGVCCALLYKKWPLITNFLLLVQSWNWMSAMFCIIENLVKFASEEKPLIF